MTELRALTPETKIELLQNAIREGYRELKAQLKDLRDGKHLTLQIKLTAPFEALVNEAHRLIEELKPIAEIDKETATTEEKLTKVLASLPTGTIKDNETFKAVRSNGTAREKTWIEKRKHDGAGITFLLSDEKLYYETFAGDALRACALLRLNPLIELGVLMARISVPYVDGLSERAKAIDITLHLHC